MTIKLPRVRRFGSGCVCALCALGNQTQAQPPGIEPIGAVVLGVSADGQAVAGYLETDKFELASFRWDTTGGLQQIGPGAAHDISRDGSTVVGDGGGVAFRWTADSGQLPLGSLVGGSGFSSAADVSGDGSVVVGLADQATGFRGFRWTSETGMTRLGDLSGGSDFSVANAISADGQIIVGGSEGSQGGRAVRWLAGNALPQDMGLPTGLTGFTEALGISPDGDVVVGVWGDDFSNQAFRWTISGGYQLLGDLPGGLVDSVAYAASVDGSVIVGVGNPGLEKPDEAFYWTEATGMQSLRSVLLNAGVDLSGWQTLLEARDISDDGTVIVGIGLTSSGEIAGFRAVIPAPASATLLLMAAGGLLLRDRRMTR